MPKNFPIYRAADGTLKCGVCCLDVHSGDDCPNNPAMGKIVADCSSCKRGLTNMDKFYRVVVASTGFEEDYHICQGCLLKVRVALGRMG